jgi:hypothetical protein
MRARLALALGFLILGVVACSGGSGSSGAGAGDISEALDPNTEPVTATTTVDTSRAVSALIGPGGGTLTATGADGSRYVLEVPADALVFETEITMTPIQSMEGLPLENGLAAGVQLEPEGISFFDFVTLTIEPAEVIPVEQQLPIGSSGDIGALYLPLIDLDPNAIRLRLTHFSSAGLSKGLLSDLEPVRQRLGGDVEARVNSLMAAEIAWARQHGQEGPDLDAVTHLQKVFREHVLDPRMKAAGESCAAARLAMETVAAYGRFRQLYALSDDSEELFGQLIPPYARTCIQEEYELCRDEHIVHRILPVISHMEQLRHRTALTAETDQIMAHAQDLAAKCLRFELEFESTARMESEGTYNESEVESKIEIQYEPGSEPPTVSGSSALVNTSYEVSNPAGGPCKTTGNRGGGTFEVTQLGFKVVRDGKDDRVGRVDDVLLAYAPGISTETITATCPGRPALTTPPASIWSNIYMAAHTSELGAEEQMRIAEEGQPPAIPQLSVEQMQSMMQSGAPPTGLGAGEAGPGSTYTTKVWQVKGGELFAEKEWDLAVSSGGASLTEEGTFRLYHRPE